MRNPTKSWTSASISKRSGTKVRECALRFAAIALLVAVALLQACAAPADEAETSDDVIARRRAIFGVFGEETNYYLYAYQPEPIRKTHKRCWYYNEVGDGDAAYRGLRGGARNFQAMSRAKPVLPYPLDDRYPREHLLFWGGANAAFAAMDAGGGALACQEAAVGLIVSPVVPVLWFPTAFEAVICGLSIWGLPTLSAEAAHQVTAGARVGDGASLDRSGTSRDSFEVLHTLHKAVLAKRDQQEPGLGTFGGLGGLGGECPSAEEAMWRYRKAFVR
jgi:hypothetical protein